MTEQTLDRVARALATGMPRRTVMKAAAAAVGLAATSLPLLRGESTAAAQSEEMCCSSQRHKFSAQCKQQGKELSLFECSARNLEHSACFVDRFDCA